MRKILSLIFTAFFIFGLLCLVSTKAKKIQYDIEAGEPIGI